jgi:hypothetical protein
MKSAETVLDNATRSLSSVVVGLNDILMAGCCAYDDYSAAIRHYYLGGTLGCK